MKEKYLRQKAYRDRNKRNEMDYRNGRREYDTRYDSMDGRYRYDYEGQNMGYEQPREYNRDYGYDMRNRDYRGRDMRYDYRDYRDYAEEDYEENYKKDLKKWIEKLKRYDRFNLPKNEIINNAKQMGVNFKDYEEDEFYAIYLMHISDYPTISNDSRMYLGMAKSWLDDKDIKIDPSEKVCRYMYEIAMADEDDDD